jgi:hypothetical protein
MGRCGAAVGCCPRLSFSADRRRIDSRTPTDATERPLENQNFGERATSTSFHPTPPGFASLLQVSTHSDEGHSSSFGNVKHDAPHGHGDEVRLTRFRA